MNLEMLLGYFSLGLIITLSAIGLDRVLYLVFKSQIEEENNKNRKTLNHF